MYKFFSVYIALVYAVPFLYVALQRSEYVLPIILYFLVIAPFYLANFLKYKSKAGLIDVSLSLRVIKLVVVGYFCCRINYIHELTLNVINGTYFSYAYELTVSRYSDSMGAATESSIAEKISTILFIAYASILGINWRKIDKKFISIFLLMIIIELSNTAKAGVLLALSALSIELIILNGNNIKKFNFFSWIKYLVSVLTVLIVIAMFSAFGRLSANDDLYELLVEKVSNYVLGTYEALFFWLKESVWVEAEFGFNVLGGVYKIFGFEIPQGHYTPIETTFGETNVFTVVRDLTQDFTVIGAGLFFFFAGLLFKKMDAQSSHTYYILSRYFGYIIIFFFYSPFLFFTVWVGFSLPLIFLVAKWIIQNFAFELKNCNNNLKSIEKR